MTSSRLLRTRLCEDIFRDVVGRESTGWRNCYRVAFSLFFVIFNMCFVRFANEISFNLLLRHLLSEGI